MVPAADPRARPFLSIWELPRQQPEAERGVAVRLTRLLLLVTQLFAVSFFGAFLNTAHADTLFDSMRKASLICV